jgi:hypothetical protein
MQINPLPGANRTNLLHDLKWVRDQAASLRSVNNADLWQKYLTWTAESERLLRTHVSDGVITRLIRTPRYMVISANSGVGRPLIDTEVDGRVVLLEDAVTELEAETQRWDRGGVLVVPDTSFFMTHPAKVEETDFSQLIGCRDLPVRLVVPMVVIDELDSLKRAGQQQRRWRAGYAIAVVDRVVGSALRGQLTARDRTPIDERGILRGEVTIEILLDPPGHVRLPINDDEIIDRAAVIKVMSGREVVLLTYDTGHATRGRVADLDVRKLVEPNEPGQTDGFN